MKAELFNQLYAAHGTSMTFTAVPDITSPAPMARSAPRSDLPPFTCEEVRRALVSTVEDERALIVGGTLAKATLTARCIYAHLPSYKGYPTADMPIEYVGKIVRVLGVDYRIASAKKHPASDVIHFLLTEK